MFDVNWVDITMVIVCFLAMIAIGLGPGYYVGVPQGQLSRQTGG